MTHLVILVISLLLTASCSTVPQKLDPRIFYKRDMLLNVNGFTGEGVLVVPYAKEYSFKVISKGELDLFTLTTCHREYSEEKAGERGWRGNKMRRDFDFKAAKLESEGLSCPVILGGYEIQKGRHSWAYIDFEHPSLTLGARFYCNGDDIRSNGVSICQSKVGLIQEIVFDHKVLKPDTTCTKLESTDSKTFRFKMPRGECTIRFLTAEGVDQWHRMTLIGYESILIRQE